MLLEQENQKLRIENRKLRSDLLLSKQPWASKTVDDLIAGAVHIPTKEVELLPIVRLSARRNYLLGEISVVCRLREENSFSTLTYYVADAEYLAAINPYNLAAALHERFVFELFEKIREKGNEIG